MFLIRGGCVVELTYYGSGHDDPSYNGDNGCGGNDVRYDNDNFVSVMMSNDSAAVTVATTVVLSRSVFFPKQLNKDSDTNKQVNFSLLKRGADVTERRLLKNKTN